MAGVQPQDKEKVFCYIKFIHSDNKKYLRNRIRSVLRGDNDTKKKDLTFEENHAKLYLI